MAEQQLNGADIGAGFQQVDGEGVPQRMRAYRLADAGDAAGFLAGEFDGASGDGLAGYVTRKEPPLRPHGPPIGAQDFQQFRRQHHVAIFLALALIDPHYHSLAVDVAGLRRTASEMRRPAA